MNNFITIINFFLKVCLLCNNFSLKICLLILMHNLICIGKKI